MARFFRPRTPPRTFGLKILYEPDPPSRAVTDICFVHGLTGGWDSTWTAEDSHEPWPKTLLKQDISDVRILSWGYDADIVKLWNPASNNRVGNHAQNLIGDLARRRVELENRKLIFVVHSLGGLVVEEALYLSWNSPDEHLRPVARATVAIAFLGTPHHGTDKASWGQSGLRLAKLTSQFNEDLVRLLEPGSEMLASIQSRFHGNLRIRREENNEVAITCFYEEYPYPVIGEIVPQHSAILPGYGQYGLNANHVGMTKFGSREDNNYERVVGELQRWVRTQRRALEAENPNPTVVPRQSFGPGTYGQTSAHSSPPPIAPRSTNSPYQYQQQSTPPPQDPPTRTVTRYPHVTPYQVQQQAPNYSNEDYYNEYRSTTYQPSNSNSQSEQAMQNALQESSDLARQNIASMIAADNASRRAGRGANNEYRSTTYQPSNSNPQSEQAMQNALQESSDLARQNIASMIAADTASRRAGRGASQPRIHQQEVPGSEDAWTRSFQASPAQFQDQIRAEADRQMEILRNGNQTSSDKYQRGGWYQR
ncbi:MAG: hypothetical protein M1812_007413 [Candelaria pacifica]|nr:MAG: hypothetical protein M1812_007413 [Candelaria pacifica]